MAKSFSQGKANVMRPLAELALLAAAVGFALGAQAQQNPGRGHKAAAQQATATKPSPQAGCFVIPASNKASSKNEAHTNYLLASLDCKTPLVVAAPTAFRVLGPTVANPDGVNPAITTFEEAETPQSLGCLYVYSPAKTGCAPTYAVGSGGPSAAGYGAIALVDAYDNPDAATDLSTFDSHWGLKAASFTKIYANGNGDCVTPPANGGWSVEESLDIEWAHVFAPNAAIVLVEACSASSTDLYYAEQVAFAYIEENYTAAGGQVSNSWSVDEYSGETAEDPLFASYNYGSTNILAFAAAGDCGYLDGVNNGPCYSPGKNNYPSVSPWVVSAGGTSILRNSANDYYYNETCWSGSGGGPSSYETYASSWTGGANTGSWADFQYPIFGQGNRVAPDMAFDSDPSSGVYFYNLYSVGGWGVVGGTSVASPALASIVNRAGNRLGTFTEFPLDSYGYFANFENNLIYGQLTTHVSYSANFHDVTTGSNGGPGAKALYDECTGVGAPRGLGGK